jgi:hypothetical protein
MNHGSTLAMKNDTWLIAIRPILSACFIGILFSGCAALSQSQQQMMLANSEKITIRNSEVLLPSLTPSHSSSQQGWWQLGFHRMIESDEEDPQWHYDALIAFTILKPIIEVSQELKLWRFHRRATSDKSGHKFSFIFYATRELGEKIYQSINGHPIVEQLLREKHTDRLSFYDINLAIRSNVESTSDKNWPLELQKSWPYFIMGVSQTWLSLIEQYYLKLKLDDEENLTARVENFKDINDKVNVLWESNGSHAFLHHLNALFGYQELYILEHRRGRF